MPRFRTPGTKVNENCGEKGPFSLLPQNLTAGVRGLGLANAEYAQLKAEVQGPPSAAEVEENGATNDEPHPRSLRGRLRIRKYGQNRTSLLSRGPVPGSRAGLTVRQPRVGSPAERSDAFCYLRRLGWTAVRHLRLGAMGTRRITAHAWPGLVGVQLVDLLIDFINYIVGVVIDVVIHETL